MSNTIVYDGKTAANWARELGLSHEAIRKRVRRLGSLDAAVAIGPNTRPRAKHDGKECADWARKLGISRQAMCQRIAQWGSLEAAIGRGGPRQMRKKPKPYRCKRTQDGKPVTERALELGISAATLYRRIARLGSLQAAVALGGRNKPGRKPKAEP